MADRVKTSELVRRRRRFAVFAGVLAVVLLVGGLEFSPGSGIVHVIGLAAVGYGIGIGVAAAFIAVGRNPFARE